MDLRQVGDKLTIGNTRAKFLIDAHEGKRIRV